MTLFHGCYDWHSSVHGHWAILRMDQAGSGKNHHLAEKTAQRFTAEKIESVIKELQEAPSFEMPYGRSWLLRLNMELNQWAGKYGRSTPKNWIELGDYTARSLLEFYINGRMPNILTNQYRNDSFALVQLTDYLKHRGNGEDFHRILVYIKQHFLVDDLHFDPAMELDPKAFLSPFWSWIYLLARTQPDEILRQVIHNADFGEELLKPLPEQKITRGRVHHLGMNWSRAWAIRALARRLKKIGLEVEAYVAGYRHHIESALKVHKSYTRDNSDITEAEAYYSYYHWVPQFGVYALTD